MGSRFALIFLALPALAFANSLGASEEARKIAVQQAKEKSAAVLEARQLLIRENLEKSGMIQEQFTACTMRATSKEAVSDCEQSRDTATSAKGPVHPLSPKKSTRPAK